MPDYTYTSTPQMKDIGHVLGFRDNIDPGKKVTKYVRSHLAVADILPVNYHLDLSTVNQQNQRYNYAITYDFATAMENYRALCKNYDIPNNYGGLRLWLTDETQSAEEITHSFDANLIEGALNSFASKGAQVRNILRSIGNIESTQTFTSLKQKVDQGIDTAGEYAENIVNGAAQMLGADDSSEIGKLINGLATSTGHLAVDLLASGKQISLPKIWRGSNYSPSVTFSVKLVSPYGHYECVAKYIIEPLLYILLLIAPKSRDGLSYGLFQPVRIKGYGITNINLGAIENVSIRRGGKETAYNIWKQPLILDVVLTARPLTDGFAAMEPQCPDVATFLDANQIYNETSTGSPAITTVGNIIQSLRPAPQDVFQQNIGASSVNGVGISTESYQQQLQNNPIDTLKRSMPNFSNIL